MTIVIYINLLNLDFYLFVSYGIEKFQEIIYAYDIEKIIYQSIISLLSIWLK